MIKTCECKIIRGIRIITSLRSVGLRRISCSEKSRVLSAEGKIREIRVLKNIRVIREIRVQKFRVLSAEGKIREIREIRVLKIYS